MNKYRETNSVYISDDAMHVVVGATVANWDDAEQLCEAIRQVLREKAQRQRAARDRRLTDPMSYGLRIGDSVAIGQGKVIYELLGISMSYNHPGEAEALLRTPKDEYSNSYRRVNPRRLSAQNFAEVEK
jgi:hypothetical protein